MMEQYLDHDNFRTNSGYTINQECEIKREACQLFREFKQNSLTDNTDWTVLEDNKKNEFLMIVCKRAQFVNSYGFGLSCFYEVGYKRSRSRIKLYHIPTQLLKQIKQLIARYAPIQKMLERQGIR